MRMYSPKIAEELIPALYREAKARRVPMTRLVDRLLREALDTEVRSGKGEKPARVSEETALESAV